MNKAEYKLTVENQHKVTTRLSESWAEFTD